MWEQAKKLAENTPADRNRYVDFLRAASISVVVIGHWLIATAYYHDGEFAVGQLLEIRPWTQWLTWAFQVMPIFFIVGGYANAVSLESAKRKGLGYAGWLAARLTRLVTPLLILLLGWAALATGMRLYGVEKETIQLVSQAALIPTWFLAIYIMIVILAPLSYRAWERFGFISLFALVAVAVIADILFFKGVSWPSWSNYFWVWLSVHHLGYAWRDGRLGKPLQLLIYSALGLAALTLLIFKGPYPMAMVGSPDEISNTLPPKITLLALGIFQFGLLLSIEAPVRRWLSSTKPWAAVVLINSMIMTVYLWHLTVMIFLVAMVYLMGGFGLGIEPGSELWWWTRPVWILVLGGFLFPVALALSPLERVGRAEGSKIPAAVQQIAGSVLLCLGISALAMFGYGGGPRWADVIAFALVFIGGGIAGVLPRFKKS